MNPYAVVKQFEQAVAEYTGAPFVVSVSSCTMAIELALLWNRRKNGTSYRITIPARTYKSVADSIVRAGFKVQFSADDWLGDYQLIGSNVWDSARKFTSGMYAPGRMVCTSHHASKILGATQGGCVLHDDPEADAFLRRARFDGRAEGVAPKDDTFDIPSEFVRHCYLSNDVAAMLLLKLHSLPRHNDPLPNDQYADLSTMEIFR